MRLALFGIVLLSACAAGDGGRGEPAAAIAAESLPVVDIASTASDGTPVLSQVTTAAWLEHGRILVADGFGHDLALFDSTGVLLKRIGREGHGPGEFVWPDWIGRCAGDSVFVWDPRLSRMTVLTSEGSVARQFQFQARPIFLTCFPGRRFAELPAPEEMFMVDPEGHSPPMYAELLLASSTGDSLAALGRVQVGQTRPLGLVTQLAGAPDRLYVGTADSGYADIYGPGGDRLGAIRVAGPRQPPTRADYEHAVDRQLAVFPPGDREPARTQMLSIPMPDLRPAYQDLLADPTGAVWAVVSGPGDSITAIRGTTANGRSLGELHFPDWFTPFEVGTDYVLGAAQTPDGEQHVRKYRLRRGEGGARRVTRR